MKIAKLTFLLLCLVQTAWAQQSKADQLRAEINAYKECLIKLSMPQYHSKDYLLSNGKRINVAEQTDFQRDAFVSTDPLLEDPHEWINSLYMSQAKRGSNLTLMDMQDLDDWQLKSIRDIADDYFHSGNSTFHVTAHGLVDAHGVSENAISMGGQQLNAKETAELILKSMADVNHLMLNTNKQPFVVVLHCCNAAQGDNSFAKQLSEALSKEIKNVAVVGSPDIIYCEKKSDGTYTEYISSEAAMKRNKPEKKNWLVFKNGQQAEEGTSDYKSTVKNYLDSK